MIRVLFHFDASSALRVALEPLLEGLDVQWCAESDDVRFTNLLPEADILWHVLRPVTADDIARAPRLRLIQKFGSGVNTIDLAAAHEAGIAVANMPGANAQAVAEATVTLMLAALRRTTELDHRTRDGTGWPLDPRIAETVTEIAGSVVGLVGYGMVARRVDRILRAFDATVLHVRRSDSIDPESIPLGTLLASADIVSLHLPLLPATERLFDAPRFAAMKHGAIFVNTARGGLVDEPALIDALRSGQLASAGLDVFAAEPVDRHSALLSFRNVVVSPHVAWLTGPTVRRCVARAAENARALAAGDALQGLVDI